MQKGALKRFAINMMDQRLSQSATSDVRANNLTVRSLLLHTGLPCLQG